MAPDLDRLVAFYETLTPEGVARFPEFYAGDAYFKDPFNEVHGVAAIQKVFAHMFQQVKAPRFVVSERLVADNGTMLVWEFRYRAAAFGGREETMRGVTHLHFSADGRVSYHRDYWDAAEELYMKLPVIGCLMRGLRRVVAA